MKNIIKWFKSKKEINADKLAIEFAEFSHRYSYLKGKGYYDVHYSSSQKNFIKPDELLKLFKKQEENETFNFKKVKTL
jgi:hypothetical protein